MEHVEDVTNTPRTEGLRLQERVFLCNALTKVVQVFRLALRKFQIDLVPIYSSEEPAVKRPVKLCSKKRRKVGMDLLFVENRGVTSGNHPDDL